MRYRLRTLLIVLAIAPPAIAVGWWSYAKWCESRELERQLWLSDLPDLPVADFVLPAPESEPLFGPPDKMIPDWSEPQP